MATSFQKQRIATATYSFATDGGGIGTITPAVNTIIPIGAIITAVYADCTTNVAPATTSTMAIAGGGITLVAAASATTHTFNTGTVKVKMTLNGSATALKATANAPITIVVAAQAFTAGVVNLSIEYIL